VKTACDSNEMALNATRNKLAEYKLLLGEIRDYFAYGPYDRKGILLCEKIENVLSRQS
jgi:hypothetical protein